MPSSPESGCAFQSPDELGKRHPVAHVPRRDLPARAPGAMPSLRPRGCSHPATTFDVAVVVVRVSGPPRFSKNGTVKFEVLLSRQLDVCLFAARNSASISAASVCRPAAPGRPGRSSRLQRLERASMPCDTSQSASACVKGVVEIRNGQGSGSSSRAYSDAPRPTRDASPIAPCETSQSPLHADPRRRAHWPGRSSIERRGCSSPNTRRLTGGTVR